MRFKICVFLLLNLVFGVVNASFEASKVVDKKDVKQSRVYGESLFNHEQAYVRVSNREHKISSGDKISYRMWGGFDAEGVQEVDPSGRIFIPEVGPVVVKGVRSKDLNGVLKKSIRRVFTDNVGIYASLITMTEIRVYVSGDVNSPGVYGGSSQDSVLVYLSKAKGINKAGSYRDIRVLRKGKMIENYDLYEFLKNGRMQSFSFKDGDVVFVTPIKPVVSVTGAAKEAFQFEINGRVNGRSIIRLARPFPSASYVSIRGVRSGSPYNKYVPIARFNEMVLFDADEVSFEEDLQSKSIGVKVEGKFSGPSYYTLSNDATLYDLLSRVQVDSRSANVNAVSIKRVSVAKMQKKMLQESLDKLEKSVLTVPVRSDGESVIRVKEAELIKSYVSKARTVEPEGTVVVSDLGRPENIRLEDGDVIVIPQKSNLVIVSGEVLLPGVLLHSRRYRVKDYVDKLGGFTQRGDEKKMAVFKPNGSVKIVNSNYRVSPGDRVLVLPKVETKALQFAKDTVQLLYQVAITVGVGVKNF